MKTFIFFIFYSEKKRKYYLIKGNLIDLNKIHEIIVRRLDFSKKNIIDLFFDTKIKEINLVKLYNKFGNLEFLGNENKKILFKIINEEGISNFQNNENSEYHLNLIKMDSFLENLKFYYEKELENLRKEIKITWLFG